MDQGPAWPPALWIPTTLLVVGVGVMMRWDRAPRSSHGDPSPTLVTIERDDPRAEEPPQVAPVHAPVPSHSAGEPIEQESPNSEAPADSRPRAWRPAALSTEDRVRRLERDPFLAEALELQRRAMQDSRIGTEFEWLEDSLRPFVLLCSEEGIATDTWSWCLDLRQLCQRIDRVWSQALATPTLQEPVVLVLRPADLGVPELLWIDDDSSGWLLLQGTPRAEDLAPAGAVFLGKSGSGGLPWWLRVGLGEWLRTGRPVVHRTEARVPLREILACGSQEDFVRREEQLQSILDQAAYRQAFHRAAGSFVGYCLNPPRGDTHRRAALLDWAAAVRSGDRDPGAGKLLSAFGVTEVEDLETAWRATLPERPGVPP